MSYGISVDNFNDRNILDETYAHVYPRIAYSKSGGDLYPGSASYQAGDLVFVSCNSSGFVGIGNNSGNAAYAGTLGYHQAPTSGYSVVLGSKIAGNISPAVSGYGVEIFNTSSQLVFTTTPAQMFRVIATGSFSGSEANETPAEKLTFPDFKISGVDHGEFDDLTKIYVLMNNTSHIYYYTPPYFVLDILVGYEYEYTTGNRGRVHVCVQDRSYGTPYGVTGVSLNYLIVEKI